MIKTIQVEQRSINKGSSVFGSHDNQTEEYVISHRKPLDGQLGFGTDAFLEISDRAQFDLFQQMEVTRVLLV